MVPHDWPATLDLLLSAHCAGLQWLYQAHTLYCNGNSAIPFKICILVAEAVMLPVQRTVCLVAIRILVCRPLMHANQGQRDRLCKVLPFRQGERIVQGLLSLLNSCFSVEF